MDSLKELESKYLSTHLQPYLAQKMHIYQEPSFKTLPKSFFLSDFIIFLNF